MGPADSDENQHADSDIRRMCRGLGEYLSGRQYDIVSLMRVSEAIHRTIRAETLRVVVELLSGVEASNQLASFDQKAQFAKWLNSELRHAGLAIRCPKTGKPTFLEAVRDPVPERGRFRFDHMDKWGNHHYTLSRVELPALEFMPDSSVTPAGRRRESGRSR